MELDEDKIKKSFSKVKEDIESLKTQLNEVKSLIEALSKKDIFSKKSEEKDVKVPSTPEEVSSTGNQGVYAGIHSFIHSFDRHSTGIHSTDTRQAETDRQQTNQNLLQNPINQQIGLTNFQNNQQTNVSWSSSNLKQIDSLFLTLTKQEFITFITIFQLEEDIKRGISYLELSRHMSLSEGCIRTYVSQMLKKGIPLQKIRLNNKLTLLLIEKEFKALNLKQRLLSLLSKTDLNQTTLS